MALTPTSRASAQARSARIASGTSTRLCVAPARLTRRGAVPMFAEGVGAAPDLETVAAVTNAVSAAAATTLADSGFDLKALINANPLAVGAVAALGAVGVAAGTALAGAAAGGAAPKAESAAKAFEALTTADADAVLLDIRSKADRKGAPVLKGAKRRALSLAYTKTVRGEDGKAAVAAVEGFGAAAAALPGAKGAALVVLLDADGRYAPKAAAELAAAASAAAAEPGAAPAPRVAYVAGGAEAWQEADLPWRAGASFSFPSLPALPADLDALAESLKANPTAGSAALGLLGAAGAAAFVITEFDLLLELVGVLGAATLVYKNLLFADDRKRTIAGVETFIKDDIGADVNGEEIAKLAKSVLEAGAGAASAAASSASSVEGGSASGSKAEAKQWIDDWKAKQDGSEVLEKA